MVDVAIGARSGNSMIGQKISRAARASHTIFESYSGGEMSKALQSTK